MLRHPDLIRSAPLDYRGMREPCLPAMKPRYSFEDIMQAVAVSRQSWDTWGKPRPRSSTGKPIQMPRHKSAYMALLCNEHPTYKLVQHTTLPRGLAFPPIPQANAADMRVFTAEHELSDAELRQTFCYPPKEQEESNDCPGSPWQETGPDPLNPKHNDRWHSTKYLGTCGVAWALLNLMCDTHAYLRAAPR